MAPAGATWTIEYQTETVDLGPDGRATQGVKVGFKTHDGTFGSVFIPKARYNANAVKAAIDAQYAHIQAVHKLSGS